jgi:hypothetical protein
MSLPGLESWTGRIKHCVWPGGLVRVKLTPGLVDWVKYISTWPAGLDWVKYVSTSSAGWSG